MAVMSRVRVSLTGLVGLPGVSTFYCLTPSSFVPALQAFYVSCGGAFPSGISTQVEGQGDTIEATTGELVGSWSTAQPAPGGGGASGAYSAPTGGVINWLTGVVANGHRLKGRTFLVPLGGTQFDLTGSIESAALTGLRANASTLVSAVTNNFVVWHRPFPGAPAVGTKPARPAFSGSFAFVTGSSMPDKACVLRSRRD